MVGNLHTGGLHVSHPPIGGQRAGYLTRGPVLRLEDLERRLGLAALVLDRRLVPSGSELPVAFYALSEGVELAELELGVRVSFTSGLAEQLDGLMGVLGHTDTPRITMPAGRKLILVVGSVDLLERRHLIGSNTERCKDGQTVGSEKRLLLYVVFVCFRCPDNLQSLSGIRLFCCGIEGPRETRGAFHGLARMRC